LLDQRWIIDVAGAVYALRYRPKAVPASLLSHGPKSFGSISTGIRSWMVRVSALAEGTMIVHETDL
jgi:hypothetical protein